MTTPDPLALAGQIQRERDSVIPGTALLRAWSQRHPAVTRLAEVVHAVERCGASTALTDVVVLCDVLRQTIHDALDQRDALAAALRAAHEENQRLREALTLARLGLAALEVSRNGDNWDGWDIQDAAVSLGAVVSVEVGYGRYCGEDCRCAEMAADYCYRDAPSTITTRALAGGKGEG